MLAEGDPACCAKYRKTGKPAEPSGGTAELPDSPTRDDIRTAMQTVKPKIRACADKTSAKGTVKVTFRIGPDGEVASATLKDSPDPAIDACVLAAIKAVTVRPSRNGTSVSYPFVLD